MWVLGWRRFWSIFLSERRWLGDHRQRRALELHDYQPILAWIGWYGDHWHVVRYLSLLYLEFSPFRIFRNTLPINKYKLYRFHISQETYNIIRLVFIWVRGGHLTVQAFDPDSHCTVIEDTLNFCDGNYTYIDYYFMYSFVWYLTKDS